MLSIPVDHLIRAADTRLGTEVAVTGILVSQIQDQFWLISKKEDLASGEAILLSHPQLGELLFETVPHLGGGHAYFHRAVANGVIRRLDEPPPLLKMCEITYLEVFTRDKSYQLL